MIGRGNSRKRYKVQVDDRLRRSYKEQDILRKKWNEEYSKLVKIADLHMPRVSTPGGHSIELPNRLLGSTYSRSERIFLWCKACGTPWPCKTYQVACDCPPFTVEFVPEEES